ncbi:caspase-1-like [Anthonomus grandis grandis]|uniref:caspase-1-like n=1 Tax=Anthonomus grandis grandis TaxID=2921223 RepID=UPI00216511FD|nr:caspase-1-like [Anthonomus grandis grandis]
MEDNEHLETDALPFTPRFIPRHQPLARGQHPDDECYNMSHPNRGIALIFNHQFFDRPNYKERRGTSFDRDAMANVLEKMGFELHIYQDLSCAEVLDKLENVANMDHSKNSCLVVAVMSHGRTYGRISARDTEYTTSDMIEMFAGSKCPTLAGKPKLFFIQACRGERTDGGVRVETDSHGVGETVYTIPNMADILIMYATVDGYFAWRDPQKGGCFIQSLAKKLEAHHKEKDLLSILTLVNRDVAIGFQSRSADPNFHGKKEMCSIVSMLTRILYFN